MARDYLTHPIDWPELNSDEEAKEIRDDADLTLTDVELHTDPVRCPACDGIGCPSCNGTGSIERESLQFPETHLAYQD